MSRKNNTVAKWRSRMSLMLQFLQYDVTASGLFKVLLLSQSSHNYQATFKSRCENLLDPINFPSTWKS